MPDCERGWRKSSYSNPSGNCVEVYPAWLSPSNLAGPADLMLVRDSRHPDSPVLQIPARAWAVFIDSVKTA